MQQTAGNKQKTVGSKQLKTCSRGRQQRVDSRVGQLLICSITLSLIALFALFERANEQSLFFCSFQKSNRSIALFAALLKKAIEREIIQSLF